MTSRELTSGFDFWSCNVYHSTSMNNESTQNQMLCGLFHAVSQYSKAAYTALTLCRCISWHRHMSRMSLRSLNFTDEATFDPTRHIVPAVCRYGVNVDAVLVTRVIVRLVLTPFVVCNRNWAVFQFPHKSACLKLCRINSVTTCPYKFRAPMFIARWLCRTCKPTIYCVQPTIILSKPFS